MIYITLVRLSFLCKKLKRLIIRVISCHNVYIFTHQRACLSSSEIFIVNIKIYFCESLLIVVAVPAIFYHFVIFINASKNDKSLQKFAHHRHLSWLYSVTYLNRLLDDQIAVICCQRKEKHTVDYLGFIIAASKNTNEIFTVIRFNYDHFMIESALNRKLLPS